MASGPSPGPGTNRSRSASRLAPARDCGLLASVAGGCRHSPWNRDFYGCGNPALIRWPYCLPGAMAAPSGRAQHAALIAVRPGGRGLIAAAEVVSLALLW